MDLLQTYASSDDDEDEDTNNATSQSQNQNNNNNNSISSNKAGVNVKVMNRGASLHAAPEPSTLATLQLSILHQTRSNAIHTTSSSTTNSTSSNTTNTNNKNQMMIMTNPLKSSLLQPIQGPHTLGSTTDISSKTLSKGNIGYAQDNITFDHPTFDTQRNAFQRIGKALGPHDFSTNNGSNDNIVVVERTGYGHERKKFNTETKAYEVIQVQDDRFTNNNDDNDQNKNKNNTDKKRKREEELVQDSDDEINYGIWGPPTNEIKNLQNDKLTTIQKVQSGILPTLPQQIRIEREHIAERDRRKGILDGTITKDDDDDVESSREHQNFDKLVERKMAHLLPPRMESEEAKAIEPTTRFHLSTKEEFNYKGESWIVPPTELRTHVEFGDIDHHKCYVPKKCVGRLLGHNKGVQRIRLSPNTGHLLLSAGLDGKCKVWSVLSKKVCRTYIGHSAAVRDVQFNHDGTKFLSCSFDRFIRLWDVESGKVLGTYTNRRVPYIIQYYPKDDNIFVVGCSDNKIVAYDSSTGQITQEYNHHLAPVNTITFVEDDGMKMVTSSDDKKILVWEWDIGVPIKYISDPTMHSIPVATLHPSKAFIVGQSLDNQIVVYQGKDKFKVQKKKFTGHLVSGYACDIAISPDGQFVCSGDGNGKLFFWDWKKSRILQKYHAHDDGPTIACVWHPTLPSTVFTCGWDGVIKMWQ